MISKGRMWCFVSSVLDKLTHQNSKGLNCSIDSTLLSQLEKSHWGYFIFFFSSSFYLLDCFWNSFVHACSLLSAGVIVCAIIPSAQLAFLSLFCIYFLEKVVLGTVFPVLWWNFLPQVSCVFMLRSSGRRHDTVVSQISSHSTPSQELTFLPLENLQSTWLKILNYSALWFLQINTGLCALFRKLRVSWAPEGKPLRDPDQVSADPKSLRATPPLPPLPFPSLHYCLPSFLGSHLARDHQSRDG